MRDLSLWCRALILSCAGLLLASCESPSSQKEVATGRPSQKPDPFIQNIVGDVSEEHVASVMKRLGEFQTRNTVSNPNQTNRGVGAARQWILEQFTSYSPRLKVSFDTYMIPRGGRFYKDTELRNVIAILPGTAPDADKRWILISGHYDTVNIKDTTNLTAAEIAELPAPGVCDDGSGTSCVLECARVMSQYQFKATLVFVAFAGEEQGLNGAKSLSARLQKEQQGIEAVLNNDIIGLDLSGDGRSDKHRVLVFSEDPDDSPSRQIARYMHAAAAKYCPDMMADMVFRYDRFGRGGDHTPFNTVGYPAVRVTTPDENYSEQHSKLDTFANASPSYTTRVTRVNAATAAAMALAPSTPVTSYAGGTTSGNLSLPNRPGLSRGTGGYDAVMRWNEPEAETADVAGFIVVMRSTQAPDWEKEFWAGNVHQFTLPNTPIDQIVLGVKAVDREGHESPVSAYINPLRTN
jgi:Peptidase family M28